MVPLVLRRSCLRAMHRDVYRDVYRHARGDVYRDVCAVCDEGPTEPCRWLEGILDVQCKTGLIEFCRASIRQCLGKFWRSLQVLGYVAPSDTLAQPWLRYYSQCVSYITIIIFVGRYLQHLWAKTGPMTDQEKFEAPYRRPNPNTLLLYRHVNRHVCRHVYRHGYRHIYEHVYGHVYAHVYGRVYTHVYTHVYRRLYACI